MGMWTMDTPADIADREAQRRAREDARIEHDERQRKARKEDVDRRHEKSIFELKHEDPCALGHE